MRENGSDPSEDDDSENPEPIDDQAYANRFVTLTLVFEGTLGVVGLLGGMWSQVPWGFLIQPNPRSIGLGVAAGVGLFATHVALLYPGGETNPLYRYIFKPFKETLLSTLPDFSIEDILFVSIMSGLGEELLFRGWLQNQLGIIIASILFGIIHIWGKEGIGYGLYAIGIGFVLGGLFHWTNNLWAPVCAHAVNNFLGLYALKAGFIPGESN